MTDTRILFADLDGTLLDDDKNVSAEDLRSINEMISAGHRFVIATGRPLYSAKVVARELDLFREGIFLAASNGGLIYDCGTDTVISKNHLDEDTVRAFFEAASAEGLHIHTYTDDDIVSLRETEELKVYSRAIKMPYRILSRIPEDLPGPPPKLIVMSIKENSRRVLEDFEARHKDLAAGKVQSVFSNDYLLEYLPVGVSKGKALIRLCDIMGIRVENSVACGDEANDIPMLDAAGTAVVMKNGTDEAKSHADYVTDHTNNENGMTEIIHRFIL